MGRVSIGIEGLDELTNGGFPEKTVNLVSGPAGSAKSLLGMTFIHHGAKNFDEPGIYLTLEENRENLIRAMTNYGMNIEELEEQGKMYLMDMSELRRKCPDEEMEEGIVGFKALQNLLDIIWSAEK